MSTSTEAKTIRVTGIDLTGYMTTNVPRALDFYRDALGMEPTKIYPDDAGAEFTLADGATFGLWNPRDTMPFAKSQSVMLAVDDFPAALAHITSRGIPIIMQNESPVCFMAMIADPDGNQVIVHKRKPGND